MNTTNSTITGKLMINIFRKKSLSSQEEEVTLQRRFTTEFELKDYEHLKMNLNEFVKPFLSEEKPEFIVKGIVPPCSEQSERKRLVKKLKNENDFNELIKLANSSPIIFIIKPINKKKKAEKKEKKLEEKKQQVTSLKEEIKMKREQINTIRLEMKSIRGSSKETSCKSTINPIESTVSVATLVEQEQPKPQEEKLQIKLQKKEGKKIFELEKKMLTAQRKLEKLALRNEKREGKLFMNNQEKTAQPAFGTVPQQQVTGNVCEPIAPVTKTFTKQCMDTTVISKPYANDGEMVTTDPLFPKAVREELLLKLQKNEEKRAFKIEKKLEMQLIKAQRKLKKQTQKQERKELVFLLKIDHS